ncbi:MAG: 4-oxalomesaconate tautomerase [Candidatus Riflebacteria bacterium]|nr:4-oxalomesaconate tautomerase [Candidatus Riflebacteria bacterium]
MTPQEPKTPPTTAVPYHVMRGGTSKALVFRKESLPTDAAERDRLLLTIMGLPELEEKAGMGKDPLSSKIAIINPSRSDETDVDYFFAQADLGNRRIDTSVSCGNIQSAVGPYAVQTGLVRPTSPETTVRVLSVNTGVVSHLIVQTPDGRVKWDGDVAIDGVPGTAAPVLINFLHPEGSTTGKLLPTGRPSDRVCDVNVSCVDAAMPLVIVAAGQLGKTGYESPAELDLDGAMMARLEEIRRAAGMVMGLGDVSKLVMPKFVLAAPPRAGGTITSRYFTPATAHTSHAVTGALCLAVACLIEGTVAHRIARPEPGLHRRIGIEHPAGRLDAEIELCMVDGNVTVPKAAFVRTAAMLCEGMYRGH